MNSLHKISLMLGITCFSLLLGFNLKADDIEIFGGRVINVPPNVLIMFDNSGSMAETVNVRSTSTPFVSTTQYSGSYLRTRVYREINTNQWEVFAEIGSNEIVDSTEISCSTARTALNQNGHWQGAITINGTHPCGYYTSKNLRTGNYLNWYQTMGPVYRVKIDLAKETVNDLIDTTTGVRFGIMVFNSDEGGHLAAPLQSRETETEKQALKDIISSMDAETWTPLAETLAESGRYFARQSSWFNSGVNYATPSTYGGTEHAIKWRCQKNYIVIMTDGESTQDRNHRLYDTTYLNNKIIGDFDQDIGLLTNNMHTSEYYWLDSTNHQTAYSDYGSDYLDDVAKFLYDEDLLPGSVMDSSGVSYNNSDFPKQNIVTYTIGFAIDHKLLTDASDSGHGQGDYFTTQDNISLNEIFDRIIGSILALNTQYTAPVVPVNRMNKTYADNGIYLGIFSPDQNAAGLWKGNLKKFGFGDYGAVLDRDGVTVATNEDGSFKEGAHSAWYAVDGLEGLTIDKGGAGQLLKTQSERYFKTYKAGTGNITFTKSNITNALNNISATDMGVGSDAERNELLNFTLARDIYSPTYTGTGSRAREWILGDIIHSQPAILYDETNSKNVLLVGANDGLLHCFVDSDQGTDSNLQDDTVEESWAFLPWDILPNLKFLPTPESTNYSTLGDNEHNYYVDGSPTVYKSGNNRYVTFGLRRGGTNAATNTEFTNQFFTLNINDYTAPTYAWSISKDKLASAGSSEVLGQSWATPKFAKIRQTGGSTFEDVVLLTGGYDTNQDSTTPTASDSKGRAIFAVNAATGQLATTNLNTFNNFTYSKMTHCIVDFRSFDDDGDDYDDTVYAPSLGGHVFAFESKQNQDGTWDGVWSKRLLFKAQTSNGKNRKFFHAPAIARETFNGTIGEFIMLGSGDREHPNDTTVTNRMYGFKNTWSATWDDNSPITDADLIDSSPLWGSSLNSEQKAALEQQIKDGSGWYFNLVDPGEKIVSTPLLYGTVLYFTTMVPTSQTVSEEDPCYTGAGSYKAYLYGVDYLTGGLPKVESPIPHNNPPRIEIVNPIPPKLVVTKKGEFIPIPTPVPITKKKPMDRYFWHKHQ